MPGLGSALMRESHAPQVSDAPSPSLLFWYLKAPPLRDINLITQRDGDGWVNCGVVYVQVGVMA